MGGIKEEEQAGEFLRKAGVAGEILFGQLDEVKLVVLGKLVGEFRLHAQTKLLSLGPQKSGCRGFKLHQQECTFDLDALARLEFNLSRGVGGREDFAAGVFARFFKDCIHGRYCPMD